MLKKIFIATAIVTTMCMSLFSEESVNSISEFFKKNNLSLEAGTYWEYRDYKERATPDDVNWGTGYMYLKYETPEFNGFSLGVAGLAHGQLRNDFDRFGGNQDPYERDIEDRFTLPELYLKYAFGEEGKSEIVIGRFKSKSFTHIDDSHAEGGYIKINEIENIEFILGAFRQFADLDYDDGEDFGRRDDRQDFRDLDKIAPGASNYRIFSRINWQATPNLDINPYFHFHNDYCAIYGLDIDLHTTNEGTNYGVLGSIYHVNSLTDIEEDATCWVVSPYFEATNGIYGQVGFASFAGDGVGTPAMNQPLGFADYLVGVLDQDNLYAAQNCDVTFGLIGYKYKKFWTHFAAGQYGYGIDHENDRVELEMQVGYKFTKYFDVNLRFFDVNDDNQAGNDGYQRTEFRARIRF